MKIFVSEVFTLRGRHMIYVSTDFEKSKKYILKHLIDLVGASSSSENKQFINDISLSTSINELINYINIFGMLTDGQIWMYEDEMENEIRLHS